MEERRTFAADEDGELTQQAIEALMREPVKEPPSIIVVGDDDVFGITPAQPG
jgi:hypothetical protein